jgi:PAS domain-containing protein
MSKANNKFIQIRRQKIEDFLNLYWNGFDLVEQKEIMESILDGMSFQKDANYINILKKGIEEADRRAGEAERNASYMRDTISRHQEWNEEKKRVLGYSNGESFDRVFQDLVNAQEALRKIQEGATVKIAARVEVTDGLWKIVPDMNGMYWNELQSEPLYFIRKEK